MKKLFRALIDLWGLGFLWIRKLRQSSPREINPSEIRRILILGYAAIGDCVFLLPALRELRKLFPNARIVFAAPRYPTTEELMPATGLVDEVWEFEQDPRPKEMALIRARIKQGSFDVVILSHPTPARLFASAILGIALRVGHCRPLTAPHKGWSALRYAFWRLRRGLISDEFERRLTLNFKVWVYEDKEHMVSRNLRLIEALGGLLSPSVSERPILPETPEETSVAEKALEGIPLSKAIGVHIGSPHSQYGKIWPAEKWAGVCRKLTQSCDARIILIGGPDEKGAAELFVKTLGAPCLNLAGRLHLMETLAVIKRCRLVISSDTGISKAAMAMGVPTAVVWGPSDRPGYGIFWDKKRHIEIFRELPCSPCVRMGLRAEGAGVINFSNCGHHACLAELDVETVFGEISGHYQFLSRISR